MDNVKDIKKVFVAGAGLMGSQIALGCALSGYETWLYDSFPVAIDKVDGWSKKYLTERVEKGKLTKEQAEGALSKLHLTKDFDEAAKDADLTIEAIIEKKEEKEAFFKKLCGVVAADSLITTNSSFMASSLFANSVENPERLANLHYFNPALVMKLVEIVKGEHTSDKTAEILYDFAKSVGKTPVLLNKEIDGFVVNRISIAISNAALELIELGVASPEDIDIAIENGLNHPMGPFRLMDLTGIDLAYMISARQAKAGATVHGFDILKEKFEAGQHGRKTGKGWYDYNK